MKNIPTKVTLISGSEWTLSTLQSAISTLLTHLEETVRTEQVQERVHGVIRRFDELASRNRSTASWKLEQGEVVGKVTEPEDNIYEYSVWRDQALAELADSIRDEALKVA